MSYKIQLEGYLSLPLDLLHWKKLWPHSFLFSAIMCDISICFIYRCFVPIHTNTMEFHSVVLKPIFGAKLSNVNNPISRNGEVIYLAETYQQSWNLLWNVSLFGTIWCQSFVQNFKSHKFCCWIQFFEIASAIWNSFVILLRAKNRCQWLQSDSCWGWHQWHQKLKRGVVVWQ